MPDCGCFRCWFFASLFWNAQCISKKWCLEGASLQLHMWCRTWTTKVKLCENNVSYMRTTTLCCIQSVCAWVNASMLTHKQRIIIGVCVVFLKSWMKQTELKSSSWISFGWGWLCRTQRPFWNGSARAIAELGGFKLDQGQFHAGARPHKSDLIVEAPSDSEKLWCIAHIRYSDSACLLQSHQPNQVANLMWHWAGVVWMIVMPLSRGAFVCMSGLPTFLKVGHCLTIQIGFLAQYGKVLSWL